MQSEAKTVGEYIDTLPAERKPIIVALRKAITKNLPKGFEEVISYGMIGYAAHTLSKWLSCYTRIAAPVHRGGISEESYCSLSHGYVWRNARMV